MKANIKGFTLIEVLVVMLIISIVTGAVLLNINRNENKRLETFANELTQILTLTEEEAMLQPVVLGLQVKPQQIHLMRLNIEENNHKKETRWQYFQHHALALPNMPDNIELHVELKQSKSDTDETETQPQIIFSTNGDATPFTIYIGKKGKKPLYSVSGRVDGTIVNQSLS